MFVYPLLPKANNQMKCKYCCSIQAKKHGWRYAKKGKIQRYFCSKCNKGFTKGTIAFRMRNPRWKIKKAVKLRNKGFSLSQIANEVGGVSRQTIWRWLKDIRKPRGRYKITYREMRNQYGKYKRSFRIRI